jgi:hypothetical protein
VSAVVPLVISMPFLIADASSFFGMTIFHFAHRPLSNLTYWYPIHLAFTQNQSLLSTFSLLFFIVLFPAAYFCLLKRTDLHLIVVTMLQVVLAFFLTSPTVNEQYIVWLLMPMIIYVIIANYELMKLLHVLTGVVTVFTLANTGPLFLSPLGVEFGSIQRLWPIVPVMVVCSLLFTSFSIIALQKTIKDDSSTLKRIK